VQKVISDVSQAASEAVLKQGGSKDEVNKAAQAAAAAAVAAVNEAAKAGRTDLAAVAQKAAAPVVEAFVKDKNAKVGSGVEAPEGSRAAAPGV
jgi:hypothetical protein